MIAVLYFVLWCAVIIGCAVFAGWGAPWMLATGLRQAQDPPASLPRRVGPEQERTVLSEEEQAALAGIEAGLRASGAGQRDGGRR